MSYNDQEYKQLANAIVEDFVMHEVPLEDSVVKLAQDMRMNAHETRRLLEHTNLEAHLTLFKKMADHKYVEFDVVDPDRVCDRLFSSPGPDMSDAPSDAIFGKTASLNLELPDERWEKLSHDVAEDLAKDAFPVESSSEDPDPYGGVKFAQALNYASNVAEELEVRATIAHMEYTDKVAELAETFSRVSAMPFSTFEKDAYALTSPQKATSILAKIREVAPHLPAAITTKEAAEASDRFVVERAEHKLFREVVAAYDHALELAEGCKWYQQQAGPLIQ